MDPTDKERSEQPIREKEADIPPGVPHGPGLPAASRWANSPIFSRGEREKRASKARTFSDSVPTPSNPWSSNRPSPPVLSAAHTTTPWPAPESGASRQKRHRRPAASAIGAKRKAWSHSRNREDSATVTVRVGERSPSPQSRSLSCPAGRLALRRTRTSVRFGYRARKV